MILHKAVDKWYAIPMPVKTGTLIFISWVGSVSLITLNLVGTIVDIPGDNNDNGMCALVLGSIWLALAVIFTCMWWYDIENRYQKLLTQRRREAERAAKRQREDAIESRVALRTQERDAGLDRWPYDDDIDIEADKRIAQAAATEWRNRPSTTIDKSDIVRRHHLADLCEDFSIGHLMHFGSDRERA